MKRLCLIAAVGLLAACTENTVTSPSSGVQLAASLSTAPGQNKAACQVEAPATCTQQGNGAKGNFTIDTRSGGYVLVYLNDLGNLSGLLLGDVSQLSFRYTGAVTPGSPRISLAIDENGDGIADGYAFISAYYCNNGAGLVDAINDPTCSIQYKSETFANYAAFVAAHPTYRVAVADPNTGLNYTFIVVDEPMLVTISGVTLGKPGH
ncbi:MAG: hypothetical protein ABJC63_11315 [Gemmatimonadales bacterium]